MQDRNVWCADSLSLHTLSQRDLVHLDMHPLVRSSTLHLANQFIWSCLVGRYHLGSINCCRAQAQTLYVLPEPSSVASCCQWFTQDVREAGSGEPACHRQGSTCLHFPHVWPLHSTPAWSSDSCNSGHTTANASYKCSAVLPLCQQQPVSASAGQLVPQAAVQSNIRLQKLGRHGPGPRRSLRKQPCSGPCLSCIPSISHHP